MSFSFLKLLNIVSFSILTVFGSMSFQSSAVARSLLFPGIQHHALGLSSSDSGIANFYAERKYKPIWVGSENKSRRNALLNALYSSNMHGLPVGLYDPVRLENIFSAARSRNERGVVEMLASRVFVQYAQHLSSGILKPSSIDREIAIYPKRYGAKDLLTNFSKSSPKAYLASLAPSNSEYSKLLKERKRLMSGSGVESPGSKVQNIPLATLRPGAKSKNVVLMRAKLSALGYGNLGNSNVYDSELIGVVKRFQRDKGLAVDGVAGPATLRIMNGGAVSSHAKMVKLLVNLERQRWMNFPRGSRYVSVNLPDYSVSMVDDGVVSFKSRTVIGKTKDTFRTPEFFDKMTHIVINPTWNIPKSIAVKEYIPIIKKDSNFLKSRNMFIVDSSGKPVNPSISELSQYNKDNYKTFPYFIKQKPDLKNALGQVKFMFPNKFNIYLHDTPSKALFGKNRRAFSHGCVRVQDPFDFAYKLLERQYKDPQGYFHSKLDTRKETFVNLAKPLPVYITYRTVYFDGAKRPIYRSDIYGRDVKVYNALKRVGVSLGG